MKAKVINAKIQYRFHGLSIILLLVLISCEDFVKVDLPETQIGSDAVFTNDATARAAIASIYSQMNVSAPSFASGGRTSLSFLSGLSADELVAFSSTSEPFYLNNVLPTDGNVSSIWNKCYNIIYSSNAIIEGLDNSDQVTLSLKNQLKGEALFIRSFCHFYLTNLWGDVPYISSSDYRINGVVSRTPIPQVYRSIIEDLVTAISLLTDAYPSSGRVRPNKWVAKALLARVYLYSEEWDNAEEESTSIIDNTVLYNLVNLNDVFLKNSTEAIWQLFPHSGSNNSFDAETFVLTGTPQWAAMSNDLLNAFEIGDKRYDAWVGSVSTGASTYYFPNKYKKQPSEEETEYSMIFRLGEQYLIRAEARARQDKLTDAIADIDTIRQRAELLLISDINPTINKADLLLAIEQERRIELFTEWGHRWLDLKRTNRANNVLATKLGWEPTDVLLPLPESEVLRNLNLVQNPGY